MNRLVAVGPALVVAITAFFALPHTAGGFRLAKWGAFELALAALALALLARRRSTPAPAGRVSLALVAFVASAVALPALSAGVAPTHGPTALLWLSGLALVLVTAACLDGDAGARRESLVLLTATGAICAAIVLLQAAGLRFLTSDVYTGSEFRAPGTSGNPNWAAAFLGPLVPVSLALGATAERRWIHRAVALLLSLATLATLSKAGVLALLAGVLVHVLLDRGVAPRTRLTLLAGAAVAGLGALAIAGQLQWFDTLPWMRGRIFLWRAAFRLAIDHPLTGVGLGGFPPAYGRAAATLIDGNPAAFLPLSSVDFAHHDLLQLAAEGGLVTAVAFLLVVAAALHAAYVRQDPLSRAAGAAVAALFVNGLADAPLRVPTTFVLFFFLLGWLAPTASHARPWRPVLAGIVLLAAIQGVRFAAGNHHWTLGRDALRAGRPAVADLERARAYLPEHGRSASQLVRALARAGRIDAALEASRVAATLRFDLDDEIFRRDLQARSLDRAAALRMWQDFSRSYPALVTPHLRLAALHLQGSDRAAAIVAYEAVLANPQPTPRAQAAREQAAAMLRSLRAGPADDR